MASCWREARVHAYYRMHNQPPHHIVESTTTRYDTISTNEQPQVFVTTAGESTMFV
jgi:hypothetical protein